MGKEELKKMLIELQDWLKVWPEASDRKACLRHRAKYDQLDANMRDAIKESKEADWWKAAGER